MQGFQGDQRNHSCTGVSSLSPPHLLPATVKVRLVRHQVRPFEPRPQQFRSCLKLRHVAGRCTPAVECGHSGADQKNEEGTPDAIQCAKSLGGHCPRFVHVFVEQ